MSKEPEPPAPRRAARRKLDWHRAAELLAGGATIAEAADCVGCPPAAISRKWREDPTFQSWVDRAKEEACGTADPLPELRPDIQRVITREVRGGSVRVSLWLADRLKLVTPPTAQTPEDELRQMLSALTLEELREFQSLQDEA